MTIKETSVLQYTNETPADLTTEGYSAITELEQLKGAVLDDNYSNFKLEIYKLFGGDKIALELFNKMKSEYSAGSIWQD